MFDRYLTGCTPEQITAICAKAVPLAPTRTTGQLAVLLRRMVLAVDPAAAERWYRKGIRERNVTAIMDHDGTVTMSANGLPADDAEAACTRVQDLAAAAKRAGHRGLIGQIRCDLFLGLLDGRFHGMTTAQVVTTLIAQYRPDGPGSPATRPDGVTPAGTGGSEPDAGAPATRTRTGAAQGGGPGTDAALRHAGTGAAEAGGASNGIEVRVALSTLLGHDELPGEIPGLGLLPAAATRARVARQRRAQWRFAVTDHTGRLLSEGLTRRRPASVGEHPVHRDGPAGGIVEIHIPVGLLREPVPADWAALIADVAAQHQRRDAHLADLDARPADRLPGAALRRHTEIRDRTCRFPGCRRRAHATDTDHTRDHADDGATTSANTGPLCDHDHDVKHRGGWTLTQPEPGVFVWHSPLGGEYTTHGEFLLPDTPDPYPVDHGPEDGRATRSLGGPILQPYRPAQRTRPPPPVRPGRPDEPPPF